MILAGTRVTDRRGNTVVWVTIIALLLLAIGVGLLAAPQAALQHWYLLSVPLLLAALRFGLRGAVACAIMSVLVLLIVFQAAGRSVGEVTLLLERLLSASTSPDEAQSLARQLADLSAADPQTTFARGLVGLLLTIIGTAVLGSSIDNRDRATRLLERAFNLLRRYFSPQVIDSILAQEGETDLGVISARKEVTILFADLRGFTALSERLEPEETAQLLNEFFEAMTQEIFRQDGTLDKFIGDAVMAIFGDPVWHPDHPERAFRAGVAMQQRMQDLQSFWRSQGRETIGMGIGISTGPAIVGNVGATTRIEYTAIGSTVNIASRLTDLARAGQIFTTRKTYWRVQHMVEGVPREPTSVKGFANPVEIVEIMGTRLVSRPGEAQENRRLAELVSRVVDDSAFRALLLGSPEEATATYSLTDEERMLAQYVAILSGYPIFRSVPAGEIALLLASVSVEQYREGAIIVQQGAIENKFYIILRGDVVVTVLDELGRERHVASQATGDHFGELALLYDTPRTATVRTTSPVTLLVLHREQFYKVLDAAPNLRQKIEDAATSRLTGPLSRRDLQAAANSPTKSGSAEKAGVLS